MLDVKTATVIRLVYGERCEVVLLPSDAHQSPAATRVKLPLTFCVAHYWARGTRSLVPVTCTPDANLQKIGSNDLQSSLAAPL